MSKAAIPGIIAELKENVVQLQKQAEMHAMREDELKAKFEEDIEAAEAAYEDTMDEIYHVQMTIKVLENMEKGSGK